MGRYYLHKRSDKARSNLFNHLHGIYERLEARRSFYILTTTYPEKP
jgi:hypothetical protein